jgi:hypothetical protein
MVRCINQKSPLQKSVNGCSRKFISYEMFQRKRSETYSTHVSFELKYNAVRVLNEKLIEELRLCKCRTIELEEQLLSATKEEHGKGCKSIEKDDEKEKDSTRTNEEGNKASDGHSLEFGVQDIEEQRSETKEGEET